MTKLRRENLTISLVSLVTLAAFMVIAISLSRLHLVMLAALSMIVFSAYTRIAADR